MKSAPAFDRFVAETGPDYVLLDSGLGARLERIGGVVLQRPDPSAVWPRRADAKDWAAAQGAFTASGLTRGDWCFTRPLPPAWFFRFPTPSLPVGELCFTLEPTGFKHIGIFPEQAANWAYLLDHLGPGASLLNLFGYTGAASVAARAAGADVTHVDAVRQVVDWARRNLEANGLAGVRWVVEDALHFARGEVRRGHRYDVILLDPPTWGIGPKGTKWKLEDHLEPLLTAVLDLLAPGGHLILNTYSGLSPTALTTWLSRIAGPGSPFEWSAGELCIQGRDGHLLPTGSLLRGQNGLQRVGPASAT